MLLRLSKLVTLSRKDCWDWGTIASSKLSSLALIGVKHTESDQTSCHATWSKSSKCVDRTNWQINVTPPGWILSFLIVSDGCGASITEAYSRGTFGEVITSTIRNEKLSTTSLSEWIFLSFYDKHQHELRQVGLCNLNS